MSRAFSIWSCALLLSACGGGGVDARRDAASVDAGAEIDAPAELDAAIVDDAGADAGAQVDAGSSAVARGRELYDRHCALCHGADGQGYLADDAPAISNADYLRIASDEFLYTATYDGRPGTPMSPWGDAHGGPLTETDARDVVALLRSWATEPFEDVSDVMVTGDSASGAPTFAARCAPCHGAAGEGIDAVSLNNAVFHDSASDGFILRTIERGRRDTRMMGFDSMLDATQLADVVAFVRTLRREPEPEWPIEDAPRTDMLVQNPAAETPDFTLRDGRYVAAADVNAALEAGQRIVLLDARATSDWVLGHIPGAAPFPFYMVDDLAATLPDDGTWIVAYCACPHAASGAVVDQLRARGFESTAVLDEGIYFWRDAGYPMARGRLP